ncbi:isochorismatase family protein [Halosquirtibacter laminarini]|uniref:Isochorismatase family protein n=1 Tax=Halosquirtibacter laminarini TaxID=3374600 RepID=A0AC61NJ83_9BACT|nr:isochorismatase family protein [Prolixibacteraceae bacterium]
MAQTPVIFWNIDTQYDFVEQDGDLYVEGAELLKPLWEEILSYAREKNIRIISTKDHHFLDSDELSDNPDFVDTFPPHCIAFEKGSKSVLSNIEDNGFILDWDLKMGMVHLKDIYHQNIPITILKDRFDFTQGNPNSENILQIIEEKKMYIMGVAENVCVSQAAIALAKNGFHVTVISDAVKAIPGLSTPYEEWKERGIEMKRWEEVKEEIKTLF